MRWKSAPQRLRAGFEKQQDADGGDHVVNLGRIAQRMEDQRSASIDSTATTTAAASMASQ
jgi:hypothetical protein